MQEERNTATVDWKEVDVREVREAAKWLYDWCWRKTPEEPIEVIMMRRLLACVADRRGRQTGIADEMMDKICEHSLPKERRVMEFLESLPVVRPEHVVECRPMFFVLELSTGTWTPAAGGDVNETNGWLIAVIKEEDGISGTEPCRAGRWAHVDAEGDQTHRGGAD